MDARRAALALVLLGIAACGGSPPTTPAPVVATAFALKGAVTVSAPSNHPLGGVTLTIVDGPSAGQSTTTDQNGVFGFAGLTGLITLRATSSGYQTQTIAVDMTEARSISLSASQLLATLHVAPTLSTSTTTGSSRRRSPGRWRSPVTSSSRSGAVTRC